jgi:hypothetical protein
MFWRSTASTVTMAAPITVASCTERSMLGSASTIATLTTAAAIAINGISRSSDSQRRSHAALGSTFVCHTDAP